jgi:hypothetical protein
MSYAAMYNIQINAKVSFEKIDPHFSTCAAYLPQRIGEYENGFEVLVLH